MLKQKILQDLQKAVEELGLPSTDLVLSIPKNPAFGDYTSNIALQLVKQSSANGKQSLDEIAKKISQKMKDLNYLEKVEVVNGFVNFFVKPEKLAEDLQEILEQGENFGQSNFGKGKKARVEYVSANPTGPLHFGNARGGPIGDSLASVLAFCGYKVIREYLHNNVGVQVAKLGESIVNVTKGQKLEDQEYKGEYIRDLTKQIANSKLDEEETGQKAVAILLDEILNDCKNVGIKFDEIYPEGDFIKNGQTEKILGQLKKKHFLREKDGALWFAPSDEFLKDRETVVKKSDGSYTYFANDIAYHNLKFAENPGLVIDILGANHHGHVPRLQAVVKALGYDVSKFHVILYQWVRFKRHSELVKMSKRSGTFVTAAEVLSEIGRDALRFFILMHDANSPIDFDLDLAREKSTKNPVYYVQYAYARICSILTKSKFQTPNSKNVDYKLLTTNYELDLIKQISRLPELVEDIAGNFAVHRLTAYAIALADSFHKFYENCRVIGEKEDLTEARIGLITATKIVLANTLSLLGVSAPEKM